MVLVVGLASPDDDVRRGLDPDPGAPAADLHDLYLEIPDGEDLVDVDVEHVPLAFHR